MKAGSDAVDAWADVRQPGRSPAQSVVAPMTSAENRLRPAARRTACLAR
mgnify:FL=1|jgi:hypothetical protein